MVVRTRKKKDYIKVGDKNRYVRRREAPIRLTELHLVDPGRVVQSSEQGDPVFPGVAEPAATRHFLQPSAFRRHAGISRSLVGPTFRTLYSTLRKPDIDRSILSILQFSGGY